MGDVTLPNRLRLHIPIVTEEHRQSAHGVMREAADHIEALEAENARLRNALEAFLDDGDCHEEAAWFEGRLAAARAALSYGFRATLEDKT